MFGHKHEPFDIYLFNKIGRNGAIAQNAPSFGRSTEQINNNKFIVCTHDGAIALSYIFDILVESIDSI